MPFINAKRKTPTGETSPVSVALGRAKLYLSAKKVRAL
jgi:hypothetical protein